MKKIIRIAATALLALAIVAGFAFAGAVWTGERRLTRTVDVRVVPVPYAREAAALKHGKYLFETRGCAQCHGDDGRGVAVVDAPDGMYVKSPNITRGTGGVVSDYNEGDWVRAIRHGVSPKQHALVAMPSEGYSRMSDADLAALVAYVRSLAPVAGESAVIRMPLVVKARYGVGMIRDAAEKIDHRRPPAQAVPAAPTAEYGAYVAAMCTGCHGATLSDAAIAGAMPRYDTADKFVAMMRTGKRPDGSDVDKAMPFMSLRNLDDTDLHAIYAYLKTLPPRTR